eukprot:2932837-Amphidinium_carterae.1
MDDARYTRFWGGGGGLLAPKRTGGMTLLSFMQAVLGDDVPELLDANVAKEVDVREEVLGGNVGVVELEVLPVEVDGDLFVFEDVPVDADFVTLAVLGGDVPELVDGNVTMS